MTLMFHVLSVIAVTYSVIVESVLFVLGLFVVVCSKNCFPGVWTQTEFSRLQSHGRLCTYWVGKIVCIGYCSDEDNTFYPDSFMRMVM